MTINFSLYTFLEEFHRFLYVLTNFHSIIILKNYFNAVQLSALLFLFSHDFFLTHELFGFLKFTNVCVFLKIIYCEIIISITNEHLIFCSKVFNVFYLSGNKNKIIHWLLIPIDFENIKLFVSLNT